MIMSFCIKGHHSFLGFTNLMDSPPPTPPPPCSATGDFPRGPNVVESTVFYSPSLRIMKDQGGFGFRDEIGERVVDGLMSCTESLGFESSDDLSSDEWFPARPAKPVERTRWREERERRRENKFPPPISSLNHKGQRSFFLHPRRTDGRLELTEVRIHQPEILRVSREDGRLRLDLIVDEDMEIEEQEKEQEMLGEGREHEEVQEDQDFISERFQEEYQEIGDWKIASNADGYVRCHEAVNHHRHRHHPHHNLHDVWRQTCVPTR